MSRLELMFQQPERELDALHGPDGHLSADEKASAVEDFYNNLALLQHAQKHAKAPGLASATQCNDCGNDIPLGRRLALPGVRLCVDCQAHNELMEKARG